MLTDQNVSVGDSAITINILRVDGRPMTPMMFRQIPKAELLDRERDSLNGIPWGRINYFAGACHRDHLHVLWTGKGGVLYRDCVYRRRRKDAAFDDPTWNTFYWQCNSLPQLYIDGDDYGPNDHSPTAE